MKSDMHDVKRNGIRDSLSELRLVIPLSPRENGFKSRGGRQQNAVGGDGPVLAA
jgi:hypothetical protein